MGNRQELNANLRLGAALLLGLLFAAHLVVFGWRSITFDRRITADSMNYIDVARNLSAGEGLVQSAAGYNQPTFWERDFSPDFPAKTRAGHNPGYSALIAAVAAGTGLEHADAAFLLGAASYGAAVAFAFVFSRRLLGTAAGLLAAAFLAHQMRWIFLRAWTEPVVIAFLFALLAVLARPLTSPRAVAAGVIAGAALLVRDGMLPLLALGGLACLLASGRRVRLLPSFGAGAGIALAGPTAGEGQVYPPQTTAAASWFPHVSLGELGATFLQSTGWELAALVLLATLAWWRKRRDGEPIVPPEAATGLFLAAAWIGGWWIFLFAARMQVLTDTFDDRMLAPAGAVLAIAHALLLWRALPRQSRPAAAVAVFAGAMLLSTAGDAVVLGDASTTRRIYDSPASLLIGRKATARALPPDGNRSDFARWIRTSPKRLWVGRNVTPRDLVVAADAMDLPYFFRGQVPATVSFSSYPYFVRVSGTRFSAVFRARCGRHDNSYLILSKLPRAWGGFARNLLSGAPAAPGSPPADFERIADLSDGAVFRFTACDRHGGPPPRTGRMRAHGRDAA